MAQNASPTKDTQIHLSAVNGQKKSCSLPAFGPRGLDHRAIFAALAEEEKRRKRSIKKEEDAPHGLPHPHIQSSLNDFIDKSSLEESSISSDTSCSSVEFRRPEDWAKEINQNGRANEVDPLTKEQSSDVTTNLNGVSVSNLNCKRNCENVKECVNSDSETNSVKSRSEKGSVAPKGSIESITRKVRLEALKARIAAQREMYKDSSSDNDDEEPAKISRYHSDEYLHRPNKQDRKRPGRTERFLKRRSNDEHCLKKPGRQGVRYVDTGGIKHMDVTTGKPPVSGQYNCQSPSSEIQCGSDNSRSTSGNNNSDNVLTYHSAVESGSNWNNIHYCQSRDNSNSSRISSVFSDIFAANTNGLNGARSRLSISSAPSGSPTPPMSSPHSGRSLGTQQQQKLKILNNDNSGSPTQGLTVSTNLPSTSANQIGLQRLWPQPSPNDSGVSCQSVTASPVFGRAPTPPPRGSQPKMGISQIYHGNSRFLQNQRTLSSSLDTVQDSGRHSHSSTLTLLSETSSDTASPHQRISSEFQEAKPTPTSNPNKNYKAIGEDTKNGDVPVTTKRLGRPSAIYSGSGNALSVIGYISRLGAPVYSYTDQAPSSNKPDVNQSSATEATNNTNAVCPLQTQKATTSPSSESASTKESATKDTNVDDEIWKKITELYGKPQNQSSKPQPLKSNLSAFNGGTPKNVSLSQSSGDFRSNDQPVHLKPSLNKPQKRPVSMNGEHSRLKYITNSGDVSSSSAPVPPVRKHLSSSALSLDTAKQQMDISMKKDQTKRTSANFEEALQELEQIYQSLKLNDEDLLDKAERRDLPSKFQWKRNSPEPKLVNSVSSCQNGNHQDRPVFLRNSVNYPLGRSLSSDACNLMSRRRASINEEDLILFNHSPPPRTPPYRRSGVPDKIADDLAFRKQQKPASKPTSPSALQQKGVSYLQCSPVFTPTLDVEGIFREFQPQPNVEKDDLSYRKYTQADGAKILPVHPPFGIPLSHHVVGRSSPSSTDYLHALPKESPPKLAFRPRHAHDLVRDDMAYRNLRKDSNSLHSVTRNGVPEMVFPEVDGYFTNGIKPSFSINRKKQRAERSLSANIAQIIGCKNENKPFSQEFERAQSMSDIIAALEVESRKWKDIETSALNGNRSNKLAKENNLPRSVQETNRLNALKSKDVEFPLTSTETLTESHANITNGHDQTAQLNNKDIMKDVPRVVQDVWRIRAMAAMPSGGRPNYRPRSGSISSTSDYMKMPVRPPVHSPSMPTLVKSPPPPIPTRRSLFLAKTLNHENGVSSSDTEYSLSSEANVISPLDEKQLDDLLSSLAVDAKECARRTEELLSMSDCLSRESSAPENHQTLTDDQSTGSLSGEALHDIVSVSA